MSLNNQKCMTQATLINLHPNEYSQEFQYYPFPVKIHRCVESSNTLNDLSTKVCVPSKIEYLNLSAINIITGINESKILAKHYHANVNVNLMGEENEIQINGGITIKVDVSVKNVAHVKKVYVWNLCSLKNRK